MSNLSNSSKKTGGRKKNLLIDNPAWDERLNAEWYYEENEAEGVRPEGVTAGTNKKVLWQCERGHVWRAAIASRVRGNGCPYCAGKLPWPGESDLQTLMPDLAREWHPTQNGELTPMDVTPGSNRSVWWAGECGHTWLARVGDRSRGTGCPYCTGKLPWVGETDLATVMPDLAREWHPTKNGDLTPQDVTKRSGRRVFWMCSHGHEWSASVDSRSAGNGCPYCAGKLPIKGVSDLQTLRPGLAREWHPTKNGDLTPQDVTVSSGKYVIWQCGYGHEWSAPVCNRTLKGSGCPYCAGQRPVRGKSDLMTTSPELVKQWHPTKNGSLTPQDVMRGSRKRVWWVCPVCGNEWAANVCDRSSGYDCPRCAASHGEKEIAMWAESVELSVSEQWRDQNCRDKNPLPFDMMLYAVAGTALMEVALIEYDGEQHSNPDSYFNMKALTSGRGGFSYVQKHDAMKDAFCASTGRRLVRIPHTVKGLDAVSAYLESAFRSLGLGYLLD